MLVQVQTAECEQEIIKNIELMRQKLLKLTLDTAQKINKLQSETADLEVEKTFANSNSDSQHFANISANF